MFLELLEEKKFKFRLLATSYYDYVIQPELTVVKIFIKTLSKFESAKHYQHLAPSAELLRIVKHSFHARI